MRSVGGCGHGGWFSVIRVILASGLSTTSKSAGPLHCTHLMCCLLLCAGDARIFSVVPDTVQLGCTYRKARPVQDLFCALRLSFCSVGICGDQAGKGRESWAPSHGSTWVMPKPSGRDWSDPVDDDTFDTLARPARPSQASPPRPSRPSRHSRRSNDSPKSQRVSERSLQPARAQADSYKDWRQAQEEAARAIRAVEPSKRKKTRFYSRLRVCLVVCFVAGYVALVAVLVSAILSERGALGETGSECEKLCPLNTRCRMEEGEARCVALPGSNLETMELILWIVVGLPSLICIPCLFQWLLRRCCPKCWEKTVKSRWGSAAYQAYQADTEALGAMLGKPQPAEAAETSETSENPGAGEASPARSSKATKEAPSQGSSAEIGIEDGLNDLFAPLAKSRPPRASAAEEEELDLLFARKPKPKEEEGVPVRGPPKPPSTDLESAFSHLFHKRARLPKPQPKSAAVSTPGSALRSDFSAGMSVLFANVQSSKAKRSTWEAEDPDPQSQSTVIEASRVHSEAPACGGDFLDQDLGDPPDFFAFAKLVAGSVDAARSHLHDSDAASDSGDSLGHLEPSDLLDLFHPPLDGG